MMDDDLGEIIAAVREVERAARFDGVCSYDEAKTILSRAENHLAELRRRFTTRYDRS